MRSLVFRAFSVITMTGEYCQVLLLFESFKVLKKIGSPFLLELLRLTLRVLYFQVILFDYFDDYNHRLIRRSVADH